MDKMMSPLGFWGMTQLFRVRDLLLPPKRILQEADLAVGARVLDFGCGPGAFSIAAAECVGAPGKVYALDIHPKAIEAVRKHAAGRGLKNVETIHGSDPHAVETESIDVVLLYDVFHMLGDQQAVLKALHRVLKPEGLLSFSDHHMKDADVRAGVAAGGWFELSEKRRHTYRFVKAKP
jgi:ubiquinone/menaquinone biosynthesis C-methylase UbiE